MAGWRKNIIRVFTIGAWCAIGAGAIVLLIAAIQRKNHQKCKGYEIEITGGEEQFFIDKKKVEEILFSNQQPVDKLISGFNLRNMEKKLEGQYLG